MEKIPPDDWKYGPYKPENQKLKDSDPYKEVADQIDVPRLRRELQQQKDINRELEHVRADNLIIRRENMMLNESLETANRIIINQKSELVDLYRKLTGNKATT